MGASTGSPGRTAVRREGFDPTATYAIVDGVAATTVPGGDAFWAALGRGEVPAGAEAVEGGWLVAAFPVTDTWDLWEVHPQGDELVFLLAGAVDLVLDLPDGPAVVGLTAGRAVVVPAGAWHTVLVRTPGMALHITYGAGTDHRPLADHPIRVADVMGDVVADA